VVFAFSLWSPIYSRLNNTIMLGLAATRKDHLFQRLQKFHRSRRKWDGWDLDGIVERLKKIV
jgi:hypothetical protein